MLVSLEMKLKAENFNSLITIISRYLKFIPRRSSVKQLEKLLSNFLDITHIQTYLK